MECGVDRQPRKIPHFHPQHRHPPPGMTLPRRAWVWLHRLRTSVGLFTPACTNGVWPPLLPVWRRRTNRQPCCPPMSNQSTPTDCMAWRFWTMKQSNGCSTPSPRFSAAKQWFKQLAQKTKKKNRTSQGLLGVSYSVWRDDYATKNVKLVTAIPEWTKSTGESLLLLCRGSSIRLPL